jgi:hypothetical protein
MRHCATPKVANKGIVKAMKEFKQENADYFTPKSKIAE